MNKQKSKSKRIIGIAVYSIIAIAVLVAGYSFSFWESNKLQSGTNTSTYKCFSLGFSGNENNTTQSNSYPMSDDQGFTTTPRTITITNTCQTYASYRIIYHVMSGSTVSSPDVRTKLRVGVANGDRKEASALNSHSQLYPSPYSGATSYVIGAGGLQPGASETIKVYSWLAEDATNEFLNAKTISKVTINGSPASSNLITAIKQQKSSYDGIRVTSGLQTTNTDEVYYYYGNQPNNYLIMNGVEYRIVRTNEDGTVRLVTSNSYQNKAFYSAANPPSTTYVNDATLSSGFLSSQLNGWYNSYINGSSYAKYVVTGKFCNDTSGNAHDRVGSGYPSFSCNSSYTLSMNVGILTADEIKFAGDNLSYFADFDYFWTMSAYDSTTLYVYSGGQYGIAAPDNGNYASYPVINIKGNTPVVGAGTKANPFVVQL